MCIARFCTGAYVRVFRPGLVQILPALPPGPLPRRTVFDQLDKEIARCCIATKLAG